MVNGLRRIRRRCLRRGYWWDRGPVTGRTLRASPFARRRSARDRQSVPRTSWRRTADAPGSVSAGGCTSDDTSDEAVDDGGEVLLDEEPVYEELPDDFGDFEEDFTDEFGDELDDSGDLSDDDLLTEDDLLSEDDFE